MYGLLCKELGKLPREVGEGLSFPEALDLIEAWTEGAERVEPESAKPKRPTAQQLRQLFGQA